MDFDWNYVDFNKNLEVLGCYETVLQSSAFCVQAASGLDRGNLGASINRAPIQTTRV